MGIRGITVSDVRGFGAQGGLAERQAGIYQVYTSTVYFIRIILVHFISLPLAEDGY